MMTTPPQPPSPIRAIFSRPFSLNERLALLIPIPVLIIGMGLVVYGFFGPTKPPPESPPPLNTPIPVTVDAAMIAQGQDAYLAYCAACHGPAGRGLPGLGKDLVASSFVKGLNDSTLLQFIITGRPAWDAANTTGIEMPPRGGYPFLADAEIMTIISYIRASQGN